MDNMEGKTSWCLSCGKGLYKIKRTWLVECMNCGFVIPRFINEDTASMEHWAREAKDYLEVSSIG